MASIVRKGFTLTDDMFQAHIYKAGEPLKAEHESHWYAQAHVEPKPAAVEPTEAELAAAAEAAAKEAADAAEAESAGRGKKAGK